MIQLLTNGKVSRLTRAYESSVTSCRKKLNLKKLAKWVSAPNPPALLDIRTRREFEKGHIPGAVWIPPAEIRLRPWELSPPDMPLVICGSPPNELLSYLEKKGHNAIFPVSDIRAFPGPLEEGPSASRLWRPASFLEEVLPEIPRGRALDLACGTGRNAVYMALQGFEVDVVDILPDALEMARNLAARNGVQIRARQRDLRKAIPDWGDNYDLITCFLFLERKLFPYIRTVLRRGGALVFESFVETEGAMKKPRRSRLLLRSRELLQAFDGFQILRYEEGRPLRGGSTAALFARRKGSLRKLVQ